jgi:hypothetical protein
MRLNGLPPQAWRQFTTEDERRTWAMGVASLVTVDRVARLILVCGSCPACCHPFEQRLSDKDIFVGPWITRGGEQLPQLRPHVGKFDWGGTLHIPAVCYCAESHPARPPGIDHGCGAYGWFEDTPDD